MTGGGGIPVQMSTLEMPAVGSSQTPDTFPDALCGSRSWGHLRAQRWIPDAFFPDGQ